MKQRFQGLAVAVLAAAALNASAASNPPGATSGSSEGSLDINLNLTPFIIVNGFEDMTLDATSNSDISGTDNLCVGGFGFQTFSVEFGSLNGNAKVGTSSATDPFLLVDGSTSETIPYSVGFAKGASAAAADATSNDGTLGTTFQRDAADTISACETGGENATLFVSVNASAWQAVDGDTFTDTLTVQVTAN